MNVTGITSAMKKNQLARDIVKARYYYLLMLPMLLYFIIFRYVPMYGITLAFKKFYVSVGIMDSPWIGLSHFERLFSSPSFKEILANTVIISLYKIVFCFPMPIILALLLNEISKIRFRRIVQTISYLPYFMSWVILSGMIIELLSPSRGVVNYIITLFGGEPVYFLTEPKFFRAILVITNSWQSVGWGSIMYLAAISSIDTEQYESAHMDGARRFQLIRYITLPSIAPVIVMMFTLNLGNILNAGFDQIFNLYNVTVYKVADIIDTYVYRVGLIDADYSFSTAVEFFKNIIGLFFVLSANFIVKRSVNKEYGLW